MLTAIGKDEDGDKPVRCPDCSNWVCTCGRAYLDWPLEKIDRQIAMLRGVVTHKSVDCPVTYLVEQIPGFRDILISLVVERGEIAAVKELRMKIGCGLKESVDFIRSLRK